MFCSNAETLCHPWIESEIPSKTSSRLLAVSVDFLSGLRAIKQRKTLVVMAALLQAQEIQAKQHFGSPTFGPFKLGIANVQLPPKSK